MIIQIQHETRLHYAEPVTEWQAELRMEPVSDADQSCQTFALQLSQPAPVYRYQDGFGNRVHHFNLLSPGQEVWVVAASVVETHPRPRDLAGSQARFPIDRNSLPLEILDFLSFRGPVRPCIGLEAILRELDPRPGDRIVDHVQAVARYVHSHFEYAKAVTNSSSPIDDLLEKGKGVCQDFAHLMIAILRSAGVPARYVSGYIHRPEKESQSHAWCGAWVPDIGWFGIDPTNNRLVDDHFVKVAFGRDFTDVPPNKGIYRGPSEEKIQVRVETRELERLPTIYWQEQLPALDVPLTTVLVNAGNAATSGEEVEQQQQQ